jgi:hypothetical protein
MWIPHRVFFGHVAIVSGVALGLLLLVWVARRPAGIAAAIVGPTALAGAFLGFTATSGMPPTVADRIRIALSATAMLGCWLLLAAGVVLILRRSGAPRIIEAIAGALTLGIAYLAARAVLG